MEYIILSIILFSIGLFGVLTRKNVIAILMSIELMLNSINLNFVYFSRNLVDISGQIFSLFVIAMAAAEVTIGLAIVINIYREFKNVDIEGINLLKW
ncbi:NADH-quinone oxidoreductase subunit NuoK [Candidatus Saganbacteria bacterium]|nr:NADH-quinone oxidoreductase subunit NuoK [Candidatus Saganbacteria bacterium]